MKFRLIPWGATTFNEFIELEADGLKTPPTIISYKGQLYVHTMLNQTLWPEVVTYAQGSVCHFHK